MSTTIYLYLKTHNRTGLKYLGKTIQDPFKYKGSGIYWTDHLKTHGNDVTTEVLFETTDEAEFKKVALDYSRKWNIVTSKKFANLVEEEGQASRLDNYPTGKDHHWYGRKHTKEYKQYMSKKHEGENNPFYGKKHTGDLKRFGHQKRCKAVIIDNIEYVSSKEAADRLGVCKATISKWLKKGKAKLV